MAETLPDTGALLLERAPEILSRWERRVLAEDPAAKQQERPVLPMRPGLAGIRRGGAAGEGIAPG